MKHYFPSSHPRTFLAFLERDIDHLRQSGQYAAAKNRASAMSQLRRFLQQKGMRDIPFSHIQPPLIKEFELWLRKHITRNSSSCYMRSLQKPYHTAVSLGLTADTHPFADVYCGVDRTPKRAISPRELRRIQLLDIPTSFRQWTLSCGKRPYGYYYTETLRYLEFSRDLFIFSFCMRGMAFVDIAYLRWSDIHNGTVIYSRRKTGQRIEVRLEALVRSIIDRWGTSGGYLFPIIHSPVNEEEEYRQYKNGLTLYNRYLKLLGHLLGDLPLTSYTSRHSWASTAQAEHVPLSVISQGMGHESERTTRIYLQSLDPTIIDRANHRILTSVFPSP